MELKNKVIVIKIYEKPNFAPRTVKVDHFPCTIGRGKQNSIQIQEESISLEHAILYFDQESLYLEDLRSSNGISKEGVRENKILISQDTAVTLGQGVKVEVLFLNDEEEKTREIFIQNPTAQKKWLRLLLTQASVLGSLFLLSLLDRYLTFFQEDEQRSLLFLFFVFVLMVYSLASVAALFSKLHLKHYQFHRFLITFTILFVFYSLFAFFDETIDFNLKNDRLMSVLSTVIHLCIFYFGFVSVFHHIFPEKPIQRIRSLSLTIILIGLITTRLFSQFFQENTSRDFYVGSIGRPLLSLDRVSHQFERVQSQILESQKIVDLDRQRSLKEEKENEKK